MKILKYQKDTEKGLSTWVEFLLNPESESVKMGSKDDKKLQDAYKKLEYISGDEELRRIAELREKYILDQRNGLRQERKIGLADGLAEGERIGIEKGEKIRS